MYILHNSEETIMARSLRRVRVAPKGMGLNDFVAHEEGFFEQEGIEVEFEASRRCSRARSRRRACCRRRSTWQDSSGCAW
ncbi:MAG: hypothetical protein A3D95_09745 [Betaproteobacteria bacterium RIFCSPHIGHO2_12_FULL_69_13]|nr:MAG: hypothetical protein A3D95_09745 [Betaproteobacteria bacterium RIFCSPHIGHO2_12_FULL_69_13]OGA64504.1 MAG: hypothetical protein A3G83_08580 [Betaproteobacteria bacterium RIFCSPLOWO2_12_FULL_68_20]